MEIKQIITEIIAAYSGYYDPTKLSKQTGKVLKGFDQNKSKSLFEYVLNTDAFDIDTHALEHLILAIGHFQAINDKKPLAHENDVTLQKVERAVGKEKYDQCKKIASAAGRAWHVLTKEIIGFSPAIIEVKKLTWHACFGKKLLSSLNLRPAIKDLNVLILGETGTGKELFAKVLQEAAFWHEGYDKAPTASVNVAAFSEQLIDSELFGHKKGAFTGATSDRIGLIKTSHRGTFFLDEVGDLPAGTQVKLLRVIETKKVRPVGSDKEVEADVRYISATNKEMVINDFRSDLYERLAGTSISIPPLRERTEKDIEEIAKAFTRGCLDKERDYFGAEREVFPYLRKLNKEGYHWPGNVRELQSFIRGVLLGINIGEKSRRVPSRLKKLTMPDEIVPPELLNGQWTEEQAKDWYYKKVFRIKKGNRTQIAKALGLNPSTLLRRRGKEND